MEYSKVNLNFQKPNGFIQKLSIKFVGISRNVFSNSLTFLGYYKKKISSKFNKFFSLIS